MRPAEEAIQYKYKGAGDGGAERLSSDGRERTTRRVMERLLRMRWRHWISRRLFIRQILARVVRRRCRRRVGGARETVDRRSTTIYDLLTLRHHFLTASTRVSPCIRVRQRCRHADGHTRTYEIISRDPIFKTSQDNRKTNLRQS